MLASVKKGKPELRKKVHPAVVIRCVATSAAAAAVCAAARVLEGECVC